VLKKKLVFLFNFILIFSSFYFETNASSKFIVPEDKNRGRSVSKNELKENIGGEIKNVLHQCASLNRQLGEIQVELSKMQKQLFEKVEELIDNKRPFKKASRQQLRETFKVVNKVNQQLKNEATVIQDVKEQIDKDVCLKQG